MKTWTSTEGLSCVSKICAKANTRSRRPACQSSRPGVICCDAGCASGAQSHQLPFLSPRRTAVKVRDHTIALCSIVIATGTTARALLQELLLV